jgi:uncharacterized protein (TIGR02246 family)
VDNNSGSTGDEGDVRAVIETWAAAVRRKDFVGILSNHAENLVMFDVPPPLQSKGRDAYRRTWDLFFSWSREPIVFDVMEMTVTAGSDIAFVAAVMRCSGTERGKDVDLLFRLTVGLQKSEGHWTIVHEHHSLPAEP